MVPEKKKKKIMMTPQENTSEKITSHQAKVFEQL